MITKLENYRHNLSLIGITIDEVLLLNLYQNLPIDVQIRAKVILLPIAAKEGVVYGMDNITGDLVPFNFSRSSSATLFDKDKNMELVGNNIPRIDYGNYTDDVKLLVEKESTNLFRDSNLALNNDKTSGFDTLIDFDWHGYLLSTKASELRNDSATSYYYKNYAIKTNTPYSVSIFASLLIQEKPIIGATPSPTRDGYLNLSGGGEDISTLFSGKNVYRFARHRTSGAAMSWSGLVKNSTTLNRKIYVSGYQLEEQEIATSYIPTTTTTATRAADKLTYTLPASSGIYLKTNKQNTLLNKPKGLWNIHDDLDNEGIEALAIFYEDIIIGFDEETAVEEFIIPIRDKNQVVKARYALKDTDIEKNVLMSEHYIEISFALDIFFKFVRSDYIIWEGEKYIIKEDYIPDEVNKCNYKYTLRFDHWTTLLQDDTFYYMNQNLEEAEWSLMSNAATHFQLLADNANRYFGINSFNVGTIEFTELKNIRFDKVSIWDAATQIAEEYGGEWHLTGTTFHLVKKFSYGSEIDFESEVSVEKMERSKGEDSEKYTRILAFGSTRNIPANYRETTLGEAVDAIYQKRLRIPASKGKFIDAKPNMSPEEIKSAVVIFEKVYPKRLGTMSSISTVEYTDTDTDTGIVTKWNAYRYKDTGLQFKKEYEMPGVELRIAIQSGTTLNGLDFAVKFNPLGKPETDPDSQIFEIVRNEDYGKALPNDIHKPQNGDTYILYGFNIQLVSDQYIPAGEQELYDTAVEWQQDMLKDKSVFECPTMIQHFADNEMDLEIGQKIKLIHDQFEGGFRSSRIQGYEKRLLNKYQATYTVGDNAAASWAKSVDNSIKELQIAGVTYQATGKNGVYLITQFDNTPASDFNAYSAKASDARYLNKQAGGTVQGDVLFQKKIKAKEAISDQFGNETFTSGQFGNGFRTWLAANGQSYAEFDNLMVRREMIINTLTIAEIKSVGGQILLSLANMYCNAVTDGGSYWKCSFDTSNGTIANQFAVDDQVICRKFNGANIKYYWARVTSVGTDYINISKTDKDGSGIPAINDEIIQFGNRTNSARQSAILLSAYGSDAPSFKQYAGINSYDLTGKEVTVISPSGNKFTGDFVIQSSGKNVTTAISEVDTKAVNAQTAANTANTAATNAATAASNAQTSATTANNLLADIANDNKLVASEKQETKKEWDAIVSEYSKNVTQATNFGVSYTAYQIAYNALNTYITPLLSNLSTTSDIVGTTFRSTFKAYYDARTDLLNAIAAKAKSIADTAQTTAANAQSTADLAATSATTANTLISDISNDNKLTPNEKSPVRQEWNIIAAELSVNNTQADTFGITTEKTTYNTAFQTLANYLNNGTAWSSGIPTWISDANLSVTTPVVGSTFRTNWKAYYDARTALLNAVAKKAKTLADAAQSSADTANAGLLTKVAYSEYNAQMQVLNTQISSKVSQTDFNSLGDRVSSTESSITQQAGQISSVVTQVNNAQTTADSKTRTYYQDAQPTAPSGGFSVGDIWQKVTYTDTTGVVNMDSSKNVGRFEYRWNGTTWVQINFNVSGSYVTQTNESISSLVTKTGINGLGTGETLKSLIDQTPDKITLAVSQIQVGGRNYVLLPWSKSLILPEATSSLQEVNFNVSSALTSQTADATYTISFLCEPKYADGRPFSTLVIGKAGSGDTWSYRIDYYSFTRNILPDGKIKCVCTVKVNRSNGDAIYTLCRFLAETYHVKTGCTITDFKIEDGNKATTWNPAIEDTQSQIDGKTTLAEVASSLSIAANKITLSSKTIELKGETIADAIEAGQLNVGNGKFKVDPNGDFTSKNANIEGALRVSGNNQITVADASGNTRVTIKPTDITPIANIGGYETTELVNTGGAAASRSIQNETNVWYGRTFTLAAGKVYDLVIPAISISATVNTIGSPTTVYARTVIRLRNTTTYVSYEIASIEASPREFGGTVFQSARINGVVSGNWRIEIEMMAISDTYFMGTASFNLTSGSVIQVIPLSQFTEMGLNGFLTAISSNKYLHITTDGVFLRMGVNILRITETGGIQKSVNGGSSWSSL